MKVQKLSAHATTPTRAHPGDAGLDLYSPKDIYLPVEGDPELIKLGIAIDLQPDEVGLLLPRSSMNVRGVYTATGVIDAGYKGDIGVVLKNLTSSEIRIKMGERIAQIVILPVRTPEVELDIITTSTSRGTDGFGSTGK